MFIKQNGIISNSVTIKFKNQLSQAISACRIRQWSKNLLVFGAPLFSFRFGDLSIWKLSIAAFLSFCLISSAIYILNDIIDIESDRKHPRKRNRPIAAGSLTIKRATFIAILLAMSSFLLAKQINISLIVIIVLYVLIQLAYSLRLKKEPLLDIFCIATGFLLRASAGGMSAELYISPWFLLTVWLLSLFLAIEKRKAELRVVEEQGVITRKVLTRYSFPLLLRLESLVSTSAFMSYALWSAGPALNGASTSWMLLTVPFVLAGIFRYQL